MRGAISGAAVAMLLTAFFYCTFYNRFLGLRSGDGEFGGGDAFVRGILPFRDYFATSPPFSQFKAGVLLTLFGDKLIVLRTAGLVERGPVSYTHLDVYKRQAFGLRLPAWERLRRAGQG